MLRTTKTVTINGSSILKTGELVATMYCAIAEDGNVSSSQNIVNRELYEANKDSVRKDFDEFTALCRLEEDKEDNEDAE